MAVNIDRRDIKELLETIGLSVVSEHGDEIKCHCPFTENHKNGDKTPSFSFNTDKMVYQCWICGGGNLLTLIRYLQNWDQDKAEKWVIEHTSHFSENLSLIDEINKRRIVEVEDEVYFPDTILTSFNGYHPYLEERGVSKQIAKKMKVGYDPKHSGITIPHFFNNRLVGWQTRHLLKDDAGNFICDSCSGRRTPKYTNTSGFPKKNTLYNYSNAMENCRLNNEEMIVVESPMTALKLMSFGYESVVATFGSWSLEQMFSLIGCLNGVILWGDSDKAGYNNISRVLPYITKFVPVKIAPVLEQDKGDPGDLTIEEVEEYLNFCYNPFHMITNKRLFTLKDVKNGISKVW